MATNDFSFPVFCEFRFLRQTLEGVEPVGEPLQGSMTILGI